MSDASHHYKDGEVLNPYHLEGDVWTHNMMVMLEADKLKNRLDQNMYTHVLVAALLHDIGKPLARKENHEKQRVHFWGHEPMSAFLAVDILNHIDKDFKLRLNKRLILEAIAMHTDVYNVPREKLTQRLIRNKLLADMLSHLSECDYAGRFFEMGERNMELIKPESDKLANENVDDVICMVGLPCAGKSTYVERYKNGGFEVLSRDSIVMELGTEKGIESYTEAFNKVDQKEVNRIFQSRRSQMIKDHNSVIIDMTNMSRKSRRKNLEGFKNYRKTAIVIFTSLENIIDRNQKRPGKVIPEHVLERMVTSFQPPLYDEGFDQIKWIFT